MNWLKELATTTTTILAALSAIGAILIWLANRAGKLWKAWNSEQVHILEDRRLLKQIADELKPNGGSSLRDLVNRVEFRQIRLEHKVNCIYDDSTTAYFESDANGLCIAVNAAYLQLTSAVLSEVLGNDWALGIHEEDRAKVYTEWHTAIAQKRHFNMSYRMVDRRLRQSIPVTCKASPIKDTAGKIIGYLGTVKRDSYDLRTKEEVWAAGYNHPSSIDAAKYDAAKLDSRHRDNVDLALHKSDIDTDDPGT